MPYTARIARRTPGCICILIDQSGSMGENIAGGRISKSGFLADAVNKLLEELSLLCVFGDETKHYFDVCVLGYGDGVSSAFVGALAAQELVSIVDVANQPARVESRQQKVPDGAGGVIEEEVRFPIWIDAKAANGTPMCEALTRVRPFVTTWARQHPDSFPPIVLHFTDGDSTDGDPSDIARELRAVSTNDGQAILLNVHLSTRVAREIVFPNTPDELPDQFARMLFDMSSELPEPMAQRASALGYASRAGARGFIYNARVEHVLAMLDVGTKATQPSDR